MRRGDASSLRRVTRESGALIGSLGFPPLDEADQAQDPLPVSCGGYTQTDQSVMVQVGAVSGQ